MRSFGGCGIIVGRQEWLGRNLTINGKTGIISGGNNTGGVLGQGGHGIGLTTGFSTDPQRYGILTVNGSIGDDTANSLRGGSGSGVNGAQIGRVGTTSTSAMANDFPRPTEKPWIWEQN